MTLLPRALGVLLTMTAIMAPTGPATAAGTSAVWPLDPRPTVVTAFDPPAHRWSAGHRGVDLLGTTGQPVRSALAGRVTYAGLLAGRGVVVVDHGGRRTTYEPVTAAVSVGDRVLTGDVLGRLAAAGSHCPPLSCLHWGLIVSVPSDTYADPLSLLGAAPVRLLPWTGLTRTSSPPGPTTLAPSSADPGPARQARGWAWR